MNLNRYWLATAVFLFIGLQVFSQGGETSIFYQVSGKKLKQPSYLFGTFHLLGKRFIDSLPEVKKSMLSCKNMAGEIDLSDSTMTIKMLGASVMEGKTIDQLMSKQQFDSLSTYFKTQIGMSIDVFKALKPMAIATTITAMTQSKLYPETNEDRVSGSMDAYFQKLARESGMKVHGLEQAESQINILFNEFSLERQTEMLLQMMRDGEEGIEKMARMNVAYRKGDLDVLEDLMYKSGDFKPEEIEILLDKRNKAWMNKIPALMKDGGVFVAVGALHLTGPNGLIKLLEQQGFTVKPISLNLKN